VQPWIQNPHESFPVRLDPDSQHLRRLVQLSVADPDPDLFGRIWIRTFGNGSGSDNTGTKIDIEMFLVLKSVKISFWAKNLMLEKVCTKFLWDPDPDPDLADLKSRILKKIVRIRSTDRD
jgi:hypothetical protein